MKGLGPATKKDWLSTNRYNPIKFSTFPIDLENSKDFNSGEGGMNFSGFLRVRPFSRSVSLLLSLTSLLLFGCATPLAQKDLQKKIQLPKGFRIEVFAEGVRGQPRFMTFDSAGNLYVTLARAGKVLVLPDRDHDGRADEVIPFASGMRLPHGIDARHGWIYVAETGKVVRFRDLDGDLQADVKEEVISALPSGGLHWSRTLRFGPDGKLYISIGASCNLCAIKQPRRAAILIYEANGTDERVFAKGLRNSVGIAWHPETGKLWAVENGSDFLGDNQPPEEVNIVREGRHYGWPYCYGSRIPHPEYSRGEFCRARTEAAAFEMQAHSAPLGLAFYAGQMFPAEYRGDLFIAFHGSIYRTNLTGYKVVRVRVKEGRPVGIEDFATGWYTGLTILGRPTDLIVAQDGSLFVSDDDMGRIYRIVYSPR
jgi:glucose/arabinose dehydrogenase